MPRLVTKNKEWVGLVIGWSIWRLVLLGVALVADKVLPYQPTFPYYEHFTLFHHLPKFIYSWANFDGVHYLTIVKTGYVGTGLVQAFFPLYPLIIRLTTLTIHDQIVAGLVVSNLLALVVAFLWYAYIKEVAGSRLAVVSSLVLWSWPTSFFWGSYYSESLFMATVLIAFWAAHRQRWGLAGMAAAMASASRVIGIFLVPSLWWLWWSHSKSTKTKNRHWLPALQIGLGSVGLLAFMSYLYYEFHDPIYFFHVQAEFGAGRQEALVLLPQVFWRYGKMILTVPPTSWVYWSLVQELAVAIIGTMWLGWAWFKVAYQWRKKTQATDWARQVSYLLFATGAFLLPTLTGTFSSLPRYTLVCFPIYLVIARQLENRGWMMIGFLLLSLVLLLINTCLFIQGYWVA